MRRWTPLLLLAVLAGCGQGPSATRPPTPPAGSSGATLEVRVSGLPDGLAPALRIRGGRIDESFSGPKTFTDLPAGTYTVSSSPVQNASATLRYSAVDAPTVTLASGERRVVMLAHMPAYLRSTADRPDDTAGFQVHVVYTLPRDATDRQLDTNGQIHRSISAIQTWLKSQTGGAGLRLDTAGGNLDVSFVRLSQTDAELEATGPLLRNYIENELMGLGYTDPDKVYAVYHDGGSRFSCGGGAWPPLLFGNAGVMFLRGRPPGAPTCDSNELGSSPTRPQYLDFGMLHETFHTLGATPQCAPHHTLEGHASDSPTDLMYSGSQPWQPSTLDLGRNDYYGHGRGDCVDLAKSAFLEPSAPGAAPPPGWPWALVPNLGCDLLGQVQAGIGDQLNLRFVNTRSEPVDVYFIDGRGSPLLAGEVQPFAGLDFISFTMHPWLVRTKSGQCLGVYRPGTFLAKQGVVLVK